MFGRFTKKCKCSHFHFIFLCFVHLPFFVVERRNYHPHIYFEGFSTRFFQLSASRTISRSATDQAAALRSRPKTEFVSSTKDWPAAISILTMIRFQSIHLIDQSRIPFIIFTYFLILHFSSSVKL